MEEEKRKSTQIISACVQILTTQMASEKVATTVATFLKESWDDFQKMSVKTIQEEREKVTDMVGTF